MKPTRSKVLNTLIVDDDKVIQLLHKYHLRAAGVSNKPVLCSNGKEALDYILEIQDEKVHFLVLLDLNMPTFNGWEFLEVLENNFKNSRVFVAVITSSINANDKKRAEMYSSVIYYCSKPLTPHCLQEIKSLPALKSFFLEV